MKTTFLTGRWRKLNDRLRFVTGAVKCSQCREMFTLNLKRVCVRCLDRDENLNKQVAAAKCG